MPPLLSVRGISKRFGGAVALDAVDLELHSGEMLAVVGANGAGKSTLVKIICGALSSDEGEISVVGNPVKFRDVWDSYGAGIAVAHQQSTILSALTGAENIALGREPTRHGFVDKRRELEIAQQLARNFGVSLNLTKPCEEIGLGDRKILDILKALSTSPKILILDEPTATLNLSESQPLFKLLHRLRANGLGILFISHHMNEVFANCDRVAVLKDGKKVHDGPTQALESGTLVRLMIGRTMTDDDATVRHVQDGTVVALRDVTIGHLKVQTFMVQRGEIVGIAGVLGAGQSRFMERLAGVPAAVSGNDIYLNGLRRMPRSVREAVKAGIYLVPDDRLRNAVFAGLSVAENVVVTSLEENSWLGFIRPQQILNAVRSMVRSLKIKCTSPDQAILDLSGGNQQKVIFARWLAKIELSNENRPLLFLLDNPTEGVDVAAKAEIYRIISEFTQKGHSVIVSSAEFSELIRLCDRVYCISHGVIAESLSREEFSEERLLFEVR